MNIVSQRKKNLKIVPFKTADLPELLHLLDLNTPDYFDPNEKNDVVDYLKQYSSTYFVARLDNKLVGACGYHYTSANEGRISWTFIHPEYKGIGVGKALVHFCLELINKKPVTKITVWTSNLSWLFYQKFGFVVKRIEKNHWAKGLDLYYMEMQ